MHSIGGSTRVFGVIADPVEHTLSPFMHNHALEALGIDGVYVAFRVSADGLGAAMQGMCAFGIAGLNVTVPHKTAVMPHLDTCSPEAAAVGAVNTIVPENGGLTGYNTDVYGIRESLRHDAGLDRLPERVCVIGAGGAARGVIYACGNDDGVREIVVLNRTLQRAVELVADLGAAVDAALTAVPLGDRDAAVLESCGLVVNTTTVGMTPHSGESPVTAFQAFHDGQVVCDIVYNPLTTRFLQGASDRGARIVNGLGMLAWQGARSLHLWTGCEPPGELMHDVLKRRVTVA